MTRSSRSTTKIEDDLISLEMAIVDGNYKLRLPQWSNPLDHLEIEVSATNALLPWAKLWSPANMVLNARNPTRVLWAIVWPRLDMKARVWLPYGGPAGTPYDEQSERDREGESAVANTTAGDREAGSGGEVEPPQEHPTGGNDGRLGTTEAEARESEDARAHGADTTHDDDHRS